MKFLRSLTLVAGLAMAFAAMAQPVGYATKTTTVNAGVLIVPQDLNAFTGSMPYDTVPFAWQNLNLANGVKPAGWEFSNPAGSSSLTKRDFDRWFDPAGAYYSGTSPVPNSSGYPVGSKINKSNAPYWEVQLAEASETQLQKYDVLLLPVMGIPRLTTSEREKIRRFADKGGVLWIDLVQPVAFADMVNMTPGAFLMVNDTSNELVDPFHPLMRTPNTISVRDLVLVEAYGGIGGASRSVTNADLGGLSSVLGGLVSESNEWDSVAVSLTNNANRTIAVLRVGNGYVVLTTRGVSLALNQGVGGARNDGFVSLDPSETEQAVAAQKIAVNIVSLAANYPAVGGGNRKDNAVATTVNAPAIRRFTGPAPFAFSGAQDSLSGDFSDTSTPVMFSGRVVTTQNNRIVVYDSLPNRNFDHDSAGNPDDGLPDPVGSAYDIIWESQPLGTKLSSPTVIENPNSVFGAVEQVWVRDENSNVYVFDLNSAGANIAPMTTVTPPAGTVAQNDAVTPVTFQDGLVYIADYHSSNTGRIWAINAKDGTKTPSGSSDWAIFGSGQIGRPTAAPTVGYIPIDDNSGGSDKVAYIASASSSTTPAPPTISSIWIGAKGEAEESTDVSQPVPNVLRIRTRAARKNLPLADGVPGSPVAPVVRVVNTATGQFLTYAELQAAFGTMTVNPGGLRGTLEINLTATGQTYDWTNSGVGTKVSVRVDYTVDWGGPTAGSIQGDSYVRGSVRLPDQNSPVRAVIGSPALTPNGYLGVSVSNLSPGGTGSGGTFYILREVGRGSFQIRTRYELYDEISSGFNVRGGGTLTYRESIIDQDNINTAVPFIQGKISNLRLTGAPAVRNGVMYVLAAGTKTLANLGNVPADVTVMLAFKAEPGPAELVLNAPGDDNLTLKLRQPDMVKSTNQAAPTIFGTLGNGQFSIEPIANSKKVRVVIDNLANTNGNQITACLANNLPVLAEWGSSTETVVEPEGTTSGSIYGGGSAGSFNPLLYYVVETGYKALRNPVVTGDVVYMSGTTYLPDILSGLPFGSWSQDGLLYAFNTDVAPNDPFLQANTVRPWQKQLWTINGSTGAFDFSNVAPSNNLKWPQIKGIQSFDDFRIRLLQARLNGPTLYGMAAGDGGIAATYLSADPSNPGPSLSVFGQSDFLVVDTGRIARFDPSGNPIWSAENTLYAGIGAPVTSARHVRPLSEPSRVYPAGDNGYVEVDPGNNLVAQLDASGREVRTITKFKVHPSFRPDGMTQSETRELRRPNDVLFWTTYQSAAEVAATFPGETILGGAPPQERWDHWLIADTGNNRVIEVVDRYRLNNGIIEGPVYYLDDAGDTPSGGNTYSLGQGVMVWHTPSQFTGKNFAYSSLYRLVVPDGAGGTKVVFAMGFNNLEPGRRSLGLDTGAPTAGSVDNAMGYGGVLLFDGSSSAVITSYQYPAINAGTWLGETAPGSGLYAFNLPTANQAQKEAKIAGLKSVTLKYVPTASGLVLSVMLTTQDGVYELVESTVTPGEWGVRWMLPRQSYAGMRRPNGAGPFSVGNLSGNPADFRPMYARRTDSGDVLIVNGFTGKYLGGAEFGGEVFMVDGSFATGATGANDPGFDFNRPNLGFNSLSVTFQLPPVQGIRGLVRPVFAERQ